MLDRTSEEFIYVTILVTKNITAEEILRAVMNDLELDKISRSGMIRRTMRELNKSKIDVIFSTGFVTGWCLDINWEARYYVSRTERRISKKCSVRSEIVSQIIYINKYFEIGLHDTVSFICLCLRHTSSCQNAFDFRWNLWPLARVTTDLGCWVLDQRPVWYLCSLSKRD